MKRLVILAGPNGAGKTTLATAFGATSGIAAEDILNPDRFTQALVDEFPTDSPDGLRARLWQEMERQREERFQQGKSYALETNFTYHDKLKLLVDARERGYETVVIFVSLSSPDLAIARVAHRVVRGGHHIDDDKVRKRWSAGLVALAAAISLTDVVYVFDNSVDYPEGAGIIMPTAPSFTFAQGGLEAMGMNVPDYLMGWLAHHRPGDL